jgi:hypothetical protein
LLLLLPLPLLSPHTPGAIIAERLRGELLSRLAFTASAGIGPNKLLAKIGSAKNKPNQQTLLLPRAVQELMQVGQDAACGVTAERGCRDACMLLLSCSNLSGGCWVFSAGAHVNGTGWGLTDEACMLRIVRFCCCCLQDVVLGRLKGVLMLRISHLGKAGPAAAALRLSAVQIHLRSCCCVAAASAGPPLGTA